MFNDIWSKRVWTLQEAVLTRELVLQAGNAWADWTNFHAIYDIPDHILLEADHFRTYKETFLALTSLREGGTADSLTGVMHDLNRAASDHRDYVYGQLGLLKPRVVEFLKPEYSATVETVFISGSLALIKANENLDSLGSCCAGGEPKRYKLPSWCRDWADATSGCGLRDDGEVYNGLVVRRAATKNSFEITISITNTVVFLRGIVVDEIGSGVLIFSSDDQTSIDKV